MEIRSELLDVSSLGRVFKIIEERWPEFAGRKNITLAANWQGKLPKGFRTFQGTVDSFFIYTKIPRTQKEQPLDILRRVLSLHKEMPKVNMHVNFLIERAGCTVTEERADTFALGFKGDQGFIKCRIRNVDKHDTQARGNVFAEYISNLGLPLKVEKSEQGCQIKELEDVRLKVDLTGSGEFNPHSFSCRISPDVAVLERYLEVVSKRVSSGKVFGMDWAMGMSGQPPEEVTRVLKVAGGLPLPEGETDCILMFSCEAAKDLEVFRLFCGDAVEEFRINLFKFALVIGIRRDGYVVRVEGNGESLLEEKSWLEKLIGRKLKKADFKGED